MSRSAQPVQCPIHGVTSAAFACTHLASGIACGVHLASPDPDHAPVEAGPDAWPDAWCDLCDATARREGSWNARAMRAADVQLVCSKCHDAACRRNQVPTWMRGLVETPTEASARDFFATCVRETVARNAAAEAQWHLADGYARWALDDAAGVLRFTEPKLPGLAPTLLARADLLGGYAPSTGTWRWPWTELAADAAATVAGWPVMQLPAFGAVRGLPRLYSPEPLAVSLAEAWELAAVATVMLSGDVLYRVPVGDRLVFLMLRELHGAPA